jgi:carbon monoxide dehydrogenase subunit G
MEFTSEWRSIETKPEKVYLFLSDLQNLGKLMPEQVINWQADADTCSFTIKGMTDLKLKINERIPFSLISLKPEGKSPFSFTLDSVIRENNLQTEVKIMLNADLNPMLAMMAKRPLQNLVNIMVEKLQLLAI